MTDLQGTCDDKFAPVRDAMQKNFDDGLDVGASVAVVHEGRTVVDLWGGWADHEMTKPWERDTITNVWSTTKTMTALCALMLADRGEIEFDAPVAKYWPEFAANGKEGVEVRHLMAHTAGLPGWDEPMTAADLYDWDKCTSLLAAQAPWWEPGTASGYHAVTQGYLVGEVVRRVTGMSLGAFFAAELAEPRHADFHIGLDAGHHDRVSKVIPPPPLGVELAPGSLGMRVLSNPLMSAEEAWESGWREAEIPAANGHGNARSVAQVQSIVSHGGEIDGRRYLSEQGVRRIFDEQINNVDLVLAVPLRLGIGYGLTGPETPLSPNPNACYWGGWGGSVVVNDLDARMTVAYMMNRMGEGTVGDLRGFGILMGAFASLA